MTQSAKAQIIQLDSLEALSCPCGSTRRGFFNIPNPLASVHIVEISADSRPHYHKKTTEIYVVLDGEGFIELDGQKHPIKRLSAVYIPPFCRHRAIGKLQILNIPIPPFDPADEWFD